MAPLISDGGIVMIAAGEAFRNGRIHAVSCLGPLQIKRLQKRANGGLVVRSGSPECGTEIIPGGRA